MRHNFAARLREVARSKNKNRPLKKRARTTLNFLLSRNTINNNRWPQVVKKLVSFYCNGNFNDAYKNVSLLHYEIWYIFQCKILEKKSHINRMLFRFFYVKNTAQRINPIIIKLWCSIEAMILEIHYLRKKTNKETRKRIRARPWICIFIHISQLNELFSYRLFVL